MMSYFYFLGGKHKISIPKSCLIRHDEEFITFEIGMDWYEHSKECDACYDFLRDMLPTQENFKCYLDNKPLEKWYFTDGVDYYQLKSNNFSTNEYFDNKISFMIDYKTECKLNILKCDDYDNYMEYFESLELYEICTFIRDN